MTAYMIVALAGAIACGAWLAFVLTVARMLP